MTRDRRNRRVTLGTLIVGIIIGGLLISPVGAHVKGILHIKNHLDKFFLTTADANVLYINEGDAVSSAANADKLDGVDSNGFLSVNGKAADAAKLDGVQADGYLRATGKAADSDNLDGLDSSFFEPGSTFRSFGSQVRLVIGASPHSLGSWGPFTLRATCVNGGGGRPSMSVELLTSEDNTAWASDLGPVSDFDVVSSPDTIATFTAATAGAQEIQNFAWRFQAMSRSGTTILGDVQFAATLAPSAGTADCVIDGGVIQTS